MDGNPGQGDWTHWCLLEWGTRREESKMYLTCDVFLIIYGRYSFFKRSQTIAEDGCIKATCKRMGNQLQRSVPRLWTTQCKAVACCCGVNGASKSQEVPSTWSLPGSWAASSLYVAFSAQKPEKKWDELMESLSHINHRHLMLYIYSQLYLPCRFLPRRVGQTELTTGDTGLLQEEGTVST